MINYDDYKTLLFELKNTEENTLKSELNLPESNLKKNGIVFIIYYHQDLKSRGLRLNHEFCIDHIKDFCNKIFLDIAPINILDFPGFIPSAEAEVLVTAE